MGDLKKDKDFDLMVRSVMEEGEEKVPAGLWESIGARMDAQEKAVAAQRRRRFGWVIGLAAAGAATILVMLRPAGIPNSTENADAVQVAAVTQTPAPVERVADEKSPAASESGRDAGKIAKTPKPAGRIARAVEAARTAGAAGSEELARAAETAELADTAGAARSVEVAEGGTAAQTAETSASAGPVVKDYFAKYDSGEWSLPEEKRMTPWKAQLFAVASTGGNLGKHSYSLGRSASRALDFGGSTITENECIFVSIPVTVGVGLKIHFNDRWSLGFGINYTYLGRKFSGTYDDGAVEKYTCSEITNDQHYFGIPLNVYFNFATCNRFRFYAFAGGAMEKCVANKYWFDYGGSPMYLTNSVKGFQYSATFGAGMQYNFNKLLSIYIDPDFKYYFQSSKQPKSIRTTQPFQLGCELGLRFNL